MSSRGRRSTRWKMEEGRGKTYTAALIRFIRLSEGVRWQSLYLPRPESRLQPLVSHLQIQECGTICIHGYSQKMQQDVYLIAILVSHALLNFSRTMPDGSETEWTVDARSAEGRSIWYRCTCSSAEANSARAEHWSVLHTACISAVPSRDE